MDNCIAIHLNGCETTAGWSVCEFHDSLALHISQIGLLLQKQAYSLTKLNPLSLDGSFMVQKVASLYLSLSLSLKC